MSRLANWLNNRAYLISQIDYRKTIRQYEHQEICDDCLQKGEITQEEYDRIISTMGGKVIKI